MNNFLTRSLTALVFASICIGSIYVEGVMLWVFLFFTMVASHEFHGIYNSNRNKSVQILGVLFNAIVFLMVALILSEKIPVALLWLLPVFFVLFSIAQLYSKSSNQFEAIAQLTVGAFYIAIPFSMYVALSYLEGNFSYEIPLGVLFLIWANDTGAYLFGITMGKHRLFERISPKKSWEGFAGGVIVALIFAYLMSNFFDQISLEHWLVVALLVVVFGTFGDLVESMLKRSKGVKDSGTILPGHGGVLDRFDALFLAIPMIYAYLRLFL